MCEADFLHYSGYVHTNIVFICFTFDLLDLITKGITSKMTSRLQAQVTCLYCARSKR